MKKNQHLLVGGIVLLLFAGLAVTFAFFDLPISQTLFNPQNGLAIFMESFAILVEPALISLAGILLCVEPSTTKTASHSKLKIASGCVVICGSFGYLIYEYAKQGLAICLTVTLIMTLADLTALLIARRLNHETLQRLSHIAAVTAVFIVVALLAVTLLKTLWGRVRFRELTDLAQFSVWYIPQGINGHHSFPSGHTSNAATLWAVTLFVPMLHKPWQKALCYAVPTAWTALMAVGRVIAGAHYASDTLFATGITIALFYLVRRLMKNALPPTPVLDSPASGQ